MKTEVRKECKLKDKHYINPCTLAVFDLLHSPLAHGSYCPTLWKKCNIPQMGMSA